MSSLNCSICIFSTGEVLLSVYYACYLGKNHFGWFILLFIEEISSHWYIMLILSKKVAILLDLFFFSVIFNL
jgi:hypothetical protein